MTDAERAALRILETPTLMSGEKARLIAELTGSTVHPAGPAMADINRTCGVYSYRTRGRGGLPMRKPRDTSRGF